MRLEDQASKLRQLVQQTNRAQTIAITSGKGGVGKSNVAINLAVLLSAVGNRVAVVDADWGLANLDVLVETKVRANLSHVIAGQRKLREVILDLPCGVQLVPGANGLAQMASLSEFHRAHLLNELSALEAENDIVLIDTGAGIGPDVMHFASCSDIVLVVTTPEPTAITDSYSMIKLLVQNGYEGQINLLVNLATDRQDARSAYERISNVARRFLNRMIYNAGYVLIDPKVAQAVRRRQPFVQLYPRCPASRCLAALVSRLHAGKGLVQQKEGFFRRVAGWLC